MNFSPNDHRTRYECNYILLPLAISVLIRIVNGQDHIDSIFHFLFASSPVVYLVTCNNTVTHSLHDFTDLLHFGLSASKSSNPSDIPGN